MEKHLHSTNTHTIQATIMASIELAHVLPRTYSPIENLHTELLEIICDYVSGMQDFAYVYSMGYIMTIERSADGSTASRPYVATRVVMSQNVRHFSEPTANL